METRQISRREALKTATRYVSAAGAVSLLHSRGEDAPSPTTSRTSEARRFRIGACEWSLRKSDPSCFALAREIGLDGVQVDLGNLRNGIHLRKPEVQKAYLEAAKKAGVEIASLATAEFNSVALKNEPRAAIWLHDSIPVAQALGVKVILIAQFHKGDLRGDSAGVARTVDLLRELAPRAEKAGVIFGLENYLSAAENLKIIEETGSPAVQVYYDVGNSTDMGYDIYEEIRALKGQICEVHAKDGPHLLGQGRIDFGKVREALDAIAFSGWIQIEAAAPNDLTKDYRIQLAELKRHFGS